MTFIEHAAVIRVPLNLVYHQWTQFENFPDFMDGVQSVQRLADGRLLWSGEFYGEERAWYAEVNQQIPNQLLAWETTTGPKEFVTVRFFYVDEDSTRVLLQSVFEPLDYELNPSAIIAMINRRTADTLRRFKTCIENSGYAVPTQHVSLEVTTEVAWQDEHETTIEAAS